VPPSLSPEQLAFSRAQPRFINLIRLLSESLPFFDGPGWVADLPNTPERFVEEANTLHKYLAALAASFDLQAKAYRDTLAIYDHVTPQMKEDFRSLESMSPRLEAKAREAKGYVRWYQAQIDNLKQISRELKGRSDDYHSRIKRDHETIVAAYRVFLPDGAIPSVGPDSIVEPAAIASTPMPRDPDFVIGNEARPYLPRAMPALPDTNAQPNPAAVRSLSGTIDDRAGALEADAQDARRSFETRNNLMQQAQTVGHAYEAASSDLSRAVEKQGALIREVYATRSLVDRLHREELAASDMLHSEEAHFVFYASQAWIWQNAKMVALNALKVEMKTNRYFKAHTDVGRSPFLDMTEADILEYYHERRLNILNLPDGVETTVGLNKVKNSIVTLLVHAEGYASEAARLGALGSETESNEFANGLYGGMQKDSEELVKQGMNAISIPEPFATIMTKFSLKPIQ
jgi:hypothetical protein